MPKTSKSGCANKNPVVEQVKAEEPFISILHSILRETKDGMDSINERLSGFAVRLTQNGYRDIVDAPYEPPCEGDLGSVFTVAILLRDLVREGQQIITNIERIG